MDPNITRRSTENTTRYELLTWKWKESRKRGGDDQSDVQQPAIRSARLRPGMNWFHCCCSSSAIPISRCRYKTIETMIRQSLEGWRIFFPHHRIFHFRLSWKPHGQDWSTDPRPYAISLKSCENVTAPQLNIPRTGCYFHAPRSRFGTWEDIV